jgi:hypothetical protein
MPLDAKEGGRRGTPVIVPFELDLEESGKKSGGLGSSHTIPLLYRAGIARFRVLLRVLEVPLFSPQSVPTPHGS